MGRNRPIAERRTNGRFPNSHAPDLPFSYRPDILIWLGPGRAHNCHSAECGGVSEADIRAARPAGRNGWILPVRYRCTR
jgi:hypothetical protein